MPDRPLMCAPRRSSATALDMQVSAAATVDGGRDKFRGSNRTPGSRQRQVTAAVNRGREQLQVRSSATVACGQREMVTSGSFRESRKGEQQLAGIRGGSRHDLAATPSDPIS